MAIPLQKGQERVKEMKIESERGREKEAIVRHEIVSSTMENME